MAKVNRPVNPNYTPPASKSAPADCITISVEEYNHLTHMANLLEIIMHDHTVYHDSVLIVKNVLIANGLLKKED